MTIQVKGMTIQISEQDARAYLSAAVGQLTVENAALRAEVRRIEGEKNQLSAILGEMHRKLEELSPEAAREFGLSPTMDEKPSRDGAGAPKNRLEAED